jgi:hypothetical protein
MELCRYPVVYVTISTRAGAIPGDGWVGEGWAEVDGGAVVDEDPQQIAQIAKIIGPSRTITSRY